MTINATIDLENYVRKNRIGIGSFGEVYKVLDKETRKLYAAKIALTPLESSSESEIRNLKREIEILRRLNHKSVLKFIGFCPYNFNREDKPIIITELMPNGSLEQILTLDHHQREAIGWDATRKLNTIYGIASAMKYLHDNRIYHRDLKPGNILMDEFLIPKIADFGLSKILHTNEESQSAPSSQKLRGTPVYMAPEIWMELEYTKEADVYAFAFIVYEIFFDAERPFNNLQLFQIARIVTTGGRPEFKKKIPESYKNLIEKCWTQDKKDRLTFDQVVNLLENDRGFITNDINEEEYRNFISFMKDDTSSLTKSSRIFKNIDIKSILNDSNESSDDESTKITKSSKPITKTKVEPKPTTIQNVDDAIEYYKTGLKLYHGKQCEVNYPLALKNFQKAAHRGHVKAQLCYAKMLYNGDGVPKDNVRASKYFNLAADSGNTEAMKIYANMLKDGKIIPKDVERAAFYYKKAAQNDDSESMLEYAKLIYEGIYVKCNKQEASIYFQKAADKGQVEAMKMYSTMLQNGDGIPVDHNKSVVYLKLAADNDDIQSMVDYGELLLNKKDNKESIKYLKKASDKGDIEATMLYAMLLLSLSNQSEAARLYKQAADKGNIKAMFMYASIQSTENNYKEASKYYKMAADLGDVESILSYCNLLEEKDNLSESAKYYKILADKGIENAIVIYAKKLYYGEGVPVNYEQAAHYIKLAADNGDVEMINLYGVMNSKGEGIQKNKEKAEYYYKLAADKGYAIAMNNYGVLLMNKQPPNCNEALKYFKMAAENGHKDGVYNYAMNLEKGYGTAPNKKEAARLYKKNADDGHVLSMLNYGVLLISQENCSKENEKEAARYLKMAADGGNDLAMVNYGNCLMHGIGVERDEEMAMKYFELSSLQGGMPFDCDVKYVQL